MISGTREPAGCAWNEVAETPPTIMGVAVVLAMVLPIAGATIWLIFKGERSRETVAESCRISEKA